MSTAVVLNAAAVVTGARAGCFCNINATTPATCGADADVPGKGEKGGTVVLTSSGPMTSGFRRTTGVARRWPAVSKKIGVPPAEENVSSTGGVTPKAGV